MSRCPNTFKSLECLLELDRALDQQAPLESEESQLFLSKHRKIPSSKQLALPAALIKGLILALARTCTPPPSYVKEHPASMHQSHDQTFLYINDKNIQSTQSKHLKVQWNTVTLTSTESCHGFLP